MARSRGHEAEPLLREALALDPNNGVAHGLPGMRLSQRESLVAATWHLRRAIGLEGRHPELLAALGHNLIRQGEAVEAESLLAEAVAAMPGAPLPLAHHALALERLGRTDEAWAVFARLKALPGVNDKATAGQEALLHESSGSWREGLARLDGMAALEGATLLTRGRLRDRAGRYEEAWRDFIEGKARVARDSNLSYDSAGVGAHLRRLAGFFTRERMDALPRASVRRDVPQPIFVIGFPRSGTTVTEQMLTSHSRIRAGDELPFTGELVEFAAQMTGKFPDGLAGLAAADRRHIITLFRDFYLARAEQYGLLQPGAGWFTDKMPLNDIYLPLLHLAFPEAKIVALRRHPLDILVSVMSHNLTHGFNCGYRLDTASRHLVAVSDLMAHWEQIGIALHVLTYESFVHDQEAETTRLMAHLGIDMEEAQLRFHENRRLAPTPSYGQVRKPLYDKSIGRWRNYASQLESVMGTVAGALQRGGYSA